MSNDYVISVDAPDTLSETTLIAGIQSALEGVPHLLTETRSAGKLTFVTATIGGSELFAINAAVGAMDRIILLPHVLYVEGPGYFELGTATRKDLLIPTLPEVDLVNRIQTLERDTSDTLEQLRRLKHQFQFIGEPFNPTAGLLTVDIPLQLTDSDGKRITVEANIDVQVDIVDPYQTTGAQLVGPSGTSPVDGSLRVTLVDGAATIQLIATSDGLVDLGLTDVAGTGLSVSDTARVTFTP